MLNLAAKVQLAICFSKLDLVVEANPGIKPVATKRFNLAETKFMYICAVN